MKITKSYLKEVIKEELYKLSQAADVTLDKDTADEFGVPPTNKPVIDGIQDTVEKVKKLKIVPATTDTDINTVVDMAPKDVKDVIRRKYGTNLKKDSFR